MNWCPFTYILDNLITNSIHAWLTKDYRSSGMYVVLQVSTIWHLSIPEFYIGNYILFVFFFKFVSLRWGGGGGGGHYLLILEREGHKCGRSQNSTLLWVTNPQLVQIGKGVVTNSNVSHKLHALHQPHRCNPLNSK